MARLHVSWTSVNMAPSSSALYPASVATNTQILPFNLHGVGDASTAQIHARETKSAGSLTSISSPTPSLFQSPYPDGSVTPPTLSCDGAGDPLTIVRRYLRVGAASRPSVLSGRSRPQCQLIFVTQTQRPQFFLEAGKTPVPIPAPHLMG